MKSTPMSENNEEGDPPKASTLRWILATIWWSVYFLREHVASTRTPNTLCNKHRPLSTLHCRSTTFPPARSVQAFEPHIDLFVPATPANSKVEISNFQEEQPGSVGLNSPPVDHRLPPHQKVSFLYIVSPSETCLTLWNIL